MADVAWLNPMIHATASDWAARVVVNGGAAVSDNTLYAVSNFCGALDAAAISNLMIAVNVFAPDNLIASITPLYKVFGNDPWTNTNFVASDLSVQGLKGNASTKFLNSGIIPSVAYNLVNTSGGLTVYNTFPDTGSGADCDVLNVTPFFALFSNNAGNAVFNCWSNGAGDFVSAAGLSLGLGFTSGSRTSGTTGALYTANSINAFASIGSLGTVVQSPPTTFALYFFARNSTGTTNIFSAKRLSFAAVHFGLTSEQTQNLFNAVQALRVALGGGWI